MLFKKGIVSLLFVLFLSIGIEVNAAEMVDINTANKTELQTIKGIGPSIAELIIEYRTQAGPFTSIDELVNVKGINDKKLSKLADQVMVSKPE